MRDGHDGTHISPIEATSVEATSVSRLAPSQPASETAAPPPRRRTGDVALAVARCSFLMDLASGVLALAVPLMAVYLGAPALMLGVLGAAQRIGYMLVGVVAGSLSDRWGRKRLVVTSASLLIGIYIALAATHTLEGFLIWVLLAGFITGLFWSPMQAWMGDAAASGNLARSVSRFNVAWSLGFLSGTLIAGTLFSLHPSAPFLCAGAAAACILAIVSRLPTPRQQEAASAPTAPLTDPSDAPSDTVGTPPHHRFFRLAGWVSAFVGYFIVSTMNNFFPKLADEAGFSPFLIGLLITAISAARTASFFGLGAWSGWQYRERVLAASLLLGGGAAAGVGWLSGVSAYLITFLLIGTSQGVAYMSSLYYALNTPGQRGRNSGWHEFSVNAGAMSGSLIGGLAASAFGLRAPFFSGTLVAAAIALWILFGPRLPSKPPLKPANGS